MLDRDFSGMIFINYRREDARADARSIRDRLANEFGALNVFMDVDNLQPGQRFDEELARALDRCQVFLAVIGPRWQVLLGERSGQGGPDFVREEIAAALAAGIDVIPVIIERAPLPSAESLPANMRALVMHQKHDLMHDRFGTDMRELIAVVRSILKRRRGTSSAWRWLGVGSGVAALTLAGASLLLHRSLPEVPTKVSHPTDAEQAKSEPKAGSGDPGKALGERREPDAKDASATPAPKAVEPVSVQAELKAANVFMSKGRVQAARKKLLAIAGQESPDALWALARSYDPNVLASLHLPDAQPDTREAARWYRAWYFAAAKKGLVSDSIDLDRIIASMYR